MTCPLYHCYLIKRTMFSLFAVQPRDFFRPNKKFGVIYLPNPHHHPLQIYGFPRLDRFGGTLIFSGYYMMFSNDPPHPSTLNVPVVHPDYQECDECRSISRIVPLHRTSECCPYYANGDCLIVRS